MSGVSALGIRRFRSLAAPSVPDDYPWRSSLRRIFVAMPARGRWSAARSEAAAQFIAYRLIICSATTINSRACHMGALRVVRHFGKEKLQPLLCKPPSYAVTREFINPTPYFALGELPL